MAGERRFYHFRHSEGYFKNNVLVCKKNEWDSFFVIKTQKNTQKYLTRMKNGYKK